MGDELLIEVSEFGGRQQGLAAAGKHLAALLFRRLRRAAFPAPGTLRPSSSRRRSGTRLKQSRKARRIRASSSSASRISRSASALARACTNGLFIRYRAWTRDVRRLAVAGDQARLGEVEQVQHVGQAVAEDRQVDRAVPRRRRGRRASWVSRPISEIGRSPISLRHERAGAARGVELAGDDEHGVANGLGVEPPLGGPPEEPVVRIGAEGVLVDRSTPGDRCATGRSRGRASSPTSRRPRTAPPDDRAVPDGWAARR